jgi:hypothetical protein
MSDEHTGEADAPMPLKTKVIAGVIAVIVLLGAGYALMRLSSPAIPFTTPPPLGHYSFDCGFCHVLTEVPASGATP